MKKGNHHYVPQHWIKRFRGDDGNLWVREEQDRVFISIRRADDVMNSPYLYTRFDANFNGSDALEDMLGVIETHQSVFLARLCDPHEPVGEGTRHDLAAVLALQTVRHPDVLAFGRRRALALAEQILAIKCMTREEFMEKAAHLFDIAQPLLVYEEIHAKSHDELSTELEEIRSLSPQSQTLAETDTLSAFVSVCSRFHGFHMRVLDIRENEGAYVLGDTPVPQESLATGFTVPLSKRVAVAAFEAPKGQRPAIERGFATPAEIAVINRDQWERHAKLIVGESRAVLKSMPPEEPSGR